MELRQMQVIGAITAAVLMLVSSASAQVRAISTSSAVVAEEFSYRDYRIDLSRIVGHVDLEAAKTVMRKQIDLVEAVEMRPELRNFFRSVRVELTSDLPIGDGGHARGAYASSDKLVKMTALIGSRASAPVLIHELAHAVHAQLVPQGYKNEKIMAMYQASRQSGRYPPDAYVIHNEREWFAVLSTVFLAGTDSYAPFTRSRLKEQEPEAYAFLITIYGPQPSSDGAQPKQNVANVACFDVKGAGLNPRLSWVSSIGCG